jgi:opacity protein-like surface antigen
MKRILLLLSFTAFSCVAMAQWAANVNYNLWVPTGKYNSDLKLGYAGANIEFKYIFDEYLTGTFGAGYALLDYKNVLINRVEVPAEGNSDKAKLQIIPVTIGAEIYFSKDKLRPYLDIDFGVALVQASGDNFTDERTKMKTNPFLSPGLGIAYEISDNLTFNGAVKQHVLLYTFDERPEYREAFTAVGINAGLTFRF